MKIFRASFKLKSSKKRHRAIKLYKEIFSTVDETKWWRKRRKKSAVTWFFRHGFLRTNFFCCLILFCFSKTRCIRDSVPAKSIRNTCMCADRPPPIIQRKSSAEYASDRASLLILCAQNTIYKGSALKLYGFAFFTSTPSFAFAFAFSWSDSFSSFFCCVKLTTAPLLYFHARQ